MRINIRPLLASVAALIVSGCAKTTPPYATYVALIYLCQLHYYRTGATPGPKALAIIKKELDPEYALPNNALISFEADDLSAQEVRQKFGYGADPSLYKRQKITILVGGKQSTVSLVLPYFQRGKHWDVITIISHRNPADFVDDPENFASLVGETVAEKDRNRDGPIRHLKNSGSSETISSLGRLSPTDPPVHSVNSLYSGGARYKFARKTNGWWIVVFLPTTKTEYWLDEEHPDKLHNMFERRSSAGQQH